MRLLWVVSGSDPRSHCVEQLLLWSCGPRGACLFGSFMSVVECSWNIFNFVIPSKAWEPMQGFRTKTPTSKPVLHP